MKKAKVRMHGVGEQLFMSGTFFLLIAILVIVFKAIFKMNGWPVDELATEWMITYGVPISMSVSGLGLAGMMCGEPEFEDLEP